MAKHHQNSLWQPFPLGRLILQDSYRQNVNNAAARTGPSFHGTDHCHGKMLQNFPVSDECSAQRSRAGWETGAAHSSLRELQDTAHGATAGATGSCSFPLPFPHPTSLPYCKDSRWPARSHISLSSSYRNLFFNGNDSYQNSPTFVFPHFYLPASACLGATALFFCHCSSAWKLLETGYLICNQVYQP